MRKGLLFSALALVLAGGLFITPALADNDDYEATSSDVGETAAAVNAASSSSNKVINRSGSLIEIGNTTAEETTIVVRVTTNGTTEDLTLVVDKDETVLLTNQGKVADLSDWIAGDQLTFTAREDANSEELEAIRIRNLSFGPGKFGQNGFVKAIRTSTNQLDVEWNGQIYTLDTAKAKLVAGSKNPAALSDFQVGDRVRARVTDDNDGNRLTWDASIVVVLRRGNTLFMRVTRWVVSAEVTSVPVNPTVPYSLQAKILKSRSFQEGDVNNVVGNPGDTITIDVNDQTKLRRRFLGKALINEFSEGDEIKVVGRRDETNGHLVAKMIKNNSIQRLGVAQHLGLVKSVNAATYTLTITPYHNQGGKTWTIYASDKTKVVEKGEQVAFSTIQVNDIVRLRGTANRQADTVKNVTGISIVTDRINNSSN